MNRQRFVDGTTWRFGGSQEALFVVNRWGIGH